MTSHIRKWKETQLRELRELINTYNVIAVVDLQAFPAALFARLRKKLSGKAKFKVSKTKIIRKAFEGIKDKNTLSEFAGKSCGLVFTNMNPFELFSFLKKNKGSIAAKVGQIAEDDIIVPAGDTGLPPGPALSDLKAAGLEVRVQGPTIAIVKDKVVTKKGQEITKPVAGTLSKLDIKPVKVGLKLIAAYENKELFRAEILDIDTEKVFDDFVKAHQGAFNLAFNICYTTKETIPMLLGKAFRDAKAVATEAEIFNSVTIPVLLARATMQAKALNEKIPQTTAKGEASNA